ncbi:MAG: 50S ribosomal protein L29 [Nanoarchaeota archaeon]|nr:50S ribosomal protein L29 [Nanoarchaeota archaeon]
MAILKSKNLKEIDAEELKSKLKELRLELIKLSSQKASKSVSNPGRIREIKRSVARILTEENIRKKQGKKIPGIKKPRKIIKKSMFHNKNK